MLCPTDQTPLVMTDRQGVEIDYCPTCRGVWLDRGELDKIIERSAAPAAPTPPSAPQAPVHNAPHHHDPYSHGHHGHYGNKRKKKESLLGELFDF